MKIRIMGTKEECMYSQEFFRRLGMSGNVKCCSVSGLYANRGSVEYYRVYIEIESKTDSDIFVDSDRIGIPQSQNKISRRG